VPISTIKLMIITIVLLLAVAVTAVVAWLVTRQPPLTPLDIPSSSVA
jgi:hypothetical protein